MFYAGVYDGHGHGGEIRAEMAVDKIPEYMAIELSKMREKKQVTDVLDLEDEELRECLTTVYTRFHCECEKMYKDGILKAALEEKARREKEQDVRLKMNLPQDGGTTATSVLIVGNRIIIGWVGDTRAILGRHVDKNKSKTNSAGLMSRLSGMVLR